MGKICYLIPKGMYCYSALHVDEKTGVLKIRLCPYWDLKKERPDQVNGYCHLLKKGDWDLSGGGLLWDQVKECGINEEE
jgi:hypothetical protein